METLCISNTVKNISKFDRDSCFSVLLKRFDFAGLIAIIIHFSLCETLFCIAKNFKNLPKGRFLINYVNRFQNRTIVANAAKCSG